MRRVLRITAAPILRSLTRIVAAVALAKSVSGKANSRRRCMSVYAKAANRTRSQLLRNLWQLARVPNRSS